jgi:ABC-type sugar transport system permease subunit
MLLRLLKEQDISSRIIIIAALQNIPEEIYEVADIDGVSAIQKTKNMTLPFPFSFYFMRASIKS